MYTKLIKEVILANWPIMTIFFVTMVSLRLFYIIHHKTKFSFYKEIFNILGILYILLLFQLLTNSEANVGAGYNIMPFTEMTRYKFGGELFMLNVVGNIIVFIPFGFFITNYLKTKKILSPIIITIIVSTCVEFVQLGIGRSFDVDDIILNVAGSIIGMLLYFALKKVKRHSPEFLQKDRLYNIVCIIIIAVFLYYIFRVVGVFG
jgi:glycopeptide antibiotics resistance protein